MEHTLPEKEADQEICNNNVYNVNQHKSTTEKAAIAWNTLGTCWSKDTRVSRDNSMHIASPTASLFPAGGWQFITGGRRC